MPDQALGTYAELVNNATVDPAGIRHVREQHAAARDASIAAATTESRSLTASEQRTFDFHMQQVKLLDVLADERESRRKGAFATNAHRNGAGATAYASGRGGEGVYTRGGQYSFFRDQAYAQRGDWDAAKRLSEHSEVMDRMAAAGELGKEYRVNPNRTDGQGGYFVPPAYLIEQFVTYARPGRVTLDRFTIDALPSGTDSINIPLIATGTATAIQTADAAAVQSTDLTDNVVTLPVRTIAGQQDFAMQLLEQSPISMDEVFFRDLTADYAQRADLQALTGTGSSGQCKGILSASGTNSVVFTQASPTLPLLYPFILQAKAQVEKNIFMPADAIVMSPSRWNWVLSILDSSNRPLAAVDGASFNSLAVNTTPNPAQGNVGHMAGLPVYTDANMPANLGGGTNEDRIIVGRFAEAYAYEGNIRTRVLMEVLSGALQVRAQVYNYLALTAERRPKAMSIISGTGMIVTTVLAGF